MLRTKAQLSFATSGLIINCNLRDGLRITILYNIYNKLVTQYRVLNTQEASS